MRQERKVVTCLFCDLAGFTAQAEEMDPEDVAALLGPYHARVKEELERFGGTVEKFIGDAVMALFGAPVAHEDDPERALRAALAIRDFAEEQGIELRIGVTTGEALVNVDARPEAGETMATGDVVNTAARLQSAAPVGGILVSEKTHEATKTVIDYRAAEPVEAKGKAKPVPVWQAASAAPLADRAHTTQLVGRERELTQLRDALERVRDESSPQLVTLVGPPGIGKSRLVHELSRTDGELMWRKGRCLPYGDGVAFWALGEIVKQHAGILESDSPEQAQQKLRACVPDDWVESHLRPLVGAGEGRDTLGDRRAESFSAWRRFLTSLAEDQPLALVVEDVHWADDGLLDFVSQLVEWARDSPLFVLCTSRPELLERRPAWQANAIPLAPLSDDDTGRLLTGLADVEVSEDLLARAAGNPLYAEQYARLLAEGGSLEEPPLTVHGIIAARLDGLPADEKALVMDAAVVGEVFWSGALAALSSDDRWSVEERLLALERREIVRRRGSSSVEAETEYDFAHVLLRDVAYAELPRAQRAEKHVQAAEWIESLGRNDDHVELLAHHYLAAVELGRRDARARLALRDAGDRALGLCAFTAAVRYYRAALDLWPEADEERPYVLLRYGRALRWTDKPAEGELVKARELLIAAGDPGEAAEADLVLFDIYMGLGRNEQAAGRLDSAAALVMGEAKSRSKAYVLCELARFHMLEHREAKALELGRQALTMVDELGLDDLRPHVLNTVGVARARTGDPAGLEDLEQSIELALALSAVPDVMRGYNNLAATVEELGDLPRSREVLEKGLRAAERFGERGPAAGIRGNLTSSLYEAGEWDDAVRLADEFIAETGLGSRQSAVVLYTRSNIRLARDDVAGALADCHTAAEHQRQMGAAAEVSSLLSIAWTLHEMNRHDDAERAVQAVLEIARSEESYSDASWEAVTLYRLGRADDARLRLGAGPRTRWREAAELELEGRPQQAASVYADIGHLPLAARVRLFAAEALIAQGRRDEAMEQLEQALTFWRSVGATRYMRKCEELLAGLA